MRDLSAYRARQRAGDAGDRGLHDIGRAAQRHSRQRRRRPDQRGVDHGAAQCREARVVIVALGETAGRLTFQEGRDFEGRPATHRHAGRAAAITVHVIDFVIVAVIDGGFDEGPEAGRQIVGYPRTDAERRIIVARQIDGRTVGIGRIAIFRTVDNAAQRQFQPVEPLRRADKAADGPYDRPVGRNGIIEADEVGRTGAQGVERKGATEIDGRVARDIDARTDCTRAVRAVRRGNVEEVRIAEPQRTVHAVLRPVGLDSKAGVTAPEGGVPQRRRHAVRIRIEADAAFDERREAQVADADPDRREGIVVDLGARFHRDRRNHRHGRRRRDRRWGGVGIVNRRDDRMRLALVAALLRTAVRHERR